jgi:hypothetical protein
MALIVKPYTEDDVEAVKDFNRRILAFGDLYDSILLDEQCVPKWLPWGEGRDTYNEYFLAIEGGVVRGGYTLKHQPFCFTDGTIVSIGYYHHVVSEGIFLKKYANVGTLLLKDALRRSPLLYALGMGGYDRPLPRMLKASGWSHFPVPFYFRIVNPGNFFRNMQSLRSSRARRALSDLAAATGAGWLAVKMAQAISRQRGPRVGPYVVDEVEGFSDWCDEVWERCKPVYAWIALRDGKALRTFYPASDRHFTRVRVSAGGGVLGWAVVAERRSNPQFGLMRVGSILDGLGLPEDAPALVHAATRALEARNVDLIVSNQSHRAWCRALEASGFLKAPSIFIFAASKELARSLAPFEENKLSIYLNRSDGDGLPRNF